MTRNNTAYVPREICFEPSTARTKMLKQRYLDAVITIDCEYIHYLTEAYKQTGGMPVLLRRAWTHKYALEHITPVIRPGELIVGNKTRYVRGAIPYANYASDWILKELHKEKQNETLAMDEYTEIGTGGGIAAKEGDFEIFGIANITPADKKRLRDAAEYWKGKCLQDVGDSLWKNFYKDAEFVINGWKALLYTAPHDSCPEGRYVPAYDLVLNKGLKGLIKKMQEKIAKHEVTTPEECEKVLFWKAGIIACEGVIEFAKRYAEEARTLAKNERDPKQKKEYEEIAEICEWVPANPPRNFREALQSYWFTHLAGLMEGSFLGLSPGRADQYLYPFYKKDKEEGLITDKEVIELLECLRVKFTEVEYVASLSWSGLGSGNNFQHMMVGGLTRDGKSAENELSMLILDSAISMQTIQPTLGVIYTDKLSEDFLLKAIEVVKTGIGMPAWFNNDIAINHFLSHDKATLEDARDWSMGGCVEMQMQGNCYGIVQAGFINLVKVLELTIFDGVDPISKVRVCQPKKSLNTYEDVLNAYKENLALVIRVWQQYWNYVMAAHRITVPLVFNSVLIRDCIEKGKCLDDGGARYNTSPTTLCSGMVNVANSLAAIKKCVFEDKLLTLDELKQALAYNFKGYERIHKKLLDAPKYGNDEDYVDSIYVDLWKSYCEYVSRQTNYLGEKYDPAALSISAHAPFGKACGATPDGRVAGRSLADAVQSAFPGTDVNGPTALINSAVKLDSVKMRSTQLNMKFHPSVLKGVDGSKKLLALIKTYFDKGGYHVQFNVVDSAMLRDAQKHPEKYRDLIVRVAGFSAYWVELGKSIQDEIIARTEYMVV